MREKSQRVFHTIMLTFHECTGGCPRCCAASKHLEKRVAEKEREWRECQRAWESERDSRLLEAQERAQQASVQAVQEAQKRWREEAAHESVRVRQEAEAKLQQQRAEAEAEWRQEFLEQQRAQAERHKVLEEQRRAREEEGMAQERARWQREADEWKQRMEAAERARMALEQQAQEKEEQRRQQEEMVKEEVRKKKEEESQQQQQQPRFVMVPDGNAFEERLRECLEQALESLWCSDSGLAQHRARVTVVRPNAKRCGDVQVCVDGQPVALVEAKEGKTRVSHAHGLWKLNRDSLAKQVPCRILVTAQAPLCLGNRQDVLKDPCVQTHPDGTLLVVMLDKCPSQQQADAAVRSMLLHVSRAVFSALEAAEDSKDGVPAAATQLTCRNQILNALAPQLESIKALRTLYASLGGAEEDFEAQMRSGLTSGCHKTLAEPASSRKRPRKPSTVLPT